MREGGFRIGAGWEETSMSKKRDKKVKIYMKQNFG